MCVLASCGGGDRPAVQSAHVSEAAGAPVQEEHTTGAGGETEGQEGHVGGEL